MKNKPKPNIVVNRIKRNATRLMFCCSFINYGVNTEYDLLEMAKIIDDLYEDYTKLLKAHRRCKNGINSITINRETK